MTITTDAKKKPLTKINMSFLQTTQAYRSLWILP